MKHTWILKNIKAVQRESAFWRIREAVHLKGWEQQLVKTGEIMAEYNLMISAFRWGWKADAKLLFQGTRKWVWIFRLTAPVVTIFGSISKMQTASFVLSYREMETVIWLSPRLHELAFDLPNWNKLEKLKSYWININFSCRSNTI